MSSTLKKLKCLEAYIATDSALTDSVLDKVLTKLLAREQTRIQGLIQHLQQELTQFEQAYNLRSQEFYTRYNAGEMGDTMDFIEWAATLEMLTNAQKQIDLLR